MEDIKKMSVFSEDALDQCMARVFTSEEKEMFLKALKTLSEGLGEHKKAVVKRKPDAKVKIIIPSAKETFEKKILPQIKSKLNEHEKNLEAGTSRRLTMNFSELNKDYTKLSWPELLGTHLTILEEERKSDIINMIVKFNRGLLYTVCLSRAHEESATNLKQWFPEKLGINYDTAMRYITFACLIRRFPRLLVCELSFDQLLRHRQNLLEYLLDDDGLSAQLSVATELGYRSGTSNKRLRIEASEMDIPAMEYNLDPDARYYFLDQDEDTEFSKFLQGSSDLRKLMFPEDSSRAMEDEIALTLGSMSISPNLPLQSNRFPLMLGHGRGSGLPALPPPPPQQFK